MRILQVIAASLLLCGPVMAAAVPPPPPTIGVSTGNAASGTLLRPVRPIGTRVSYQTNRSDGFQQSDSGRIFEILTAHGPANSISFGYSNFSGPATEADSACSFVLTASLEIEPTLTGSSNWSITDSNAIRIPLYFNGQRQVTLSAGSPTVYTDPFYFPFYASQSIYARYWRQSTTPGCALPINRYPVAALNEYSNDAAFGYQIFASQTTPATTVTGTYSGGGGVQLPLVPGSLQLRGGTLVGTITDNGSGGFPAGNGLAAGSIVDYTTGAITLNFTATTTPSAITGYGYGRAGSVAADDTLVYSPTDTNSIGTHQIYTPSVVVGTYANTSAKTPFAFGVFGDSTVWGSGNGSGNTGDIGISWINYAVNGTAGIIKVAQPSETAAQFAAVATDYRRLNLVQGLYDRALFNYGTNDMAASVALATIKANWLKVAALIAARMPNGYKDVWAVTILPRTVGNITTPYNAAFGPGTVASGSPSTRNAFNAWVYTQIGVTIGGVCDPNVVLEGSPASQAGAGDGTWKSGTYTADFTHPNVTGNTLAGAAMAIGGSNPCAAFGLPN